MKRPKMIIFDYGHTLCYEARFDGERGSEALMRHVASNKNNISAAEINAFSNRLFDQFQAARQMGVEVHEYQQQKLRHEYLEIEFDLTPLEAEIIFWDAAAPGQLMPRTADMLHTIKEAGIRSGVISNISFSGQALKNRIQNLMPDYPFEFILASSDYAVRKPDRLLFELALKKADLAPEDVWFCGDNALADIEGAASVGIYPIWYTSPLECYYRNPDRDTAVPTCDYRQISDWNDMIALINKV